MRATATGFLGQLTVPRYEEVQRSAHGFHRDLWLLIPEVEKLTADREDAPERAALAGVGEARRRLEEIERAGLVGEVERVKRLARSVLALCDHCESLTGITMCVVCDKPIEDPDRSVPYSHGDPSESMARPGRMHPECAGIRRLH